MATIISPEAVTEIRKLIDDACANAQVSLPCASVVLVCKDNNLPTLVHSARMKEERARNSQDEGYPAKKTSHLRAAHDNIFWLASCTKLVPGIARMRLVEQGILRLDDSDEVEKLCPELAAVKVLQDDGSLVDKKNRITLRMLLTHTSEDNIHHHK